ncbi:glutamate 5-kinase [Kocuria sp. WRN011]|uniref:glutamate 5-kinase n=1 Tax=Kocuria TaxID=57493 RepID=UPI000BAFDBEC|nr:MULTISPECIES: glutamate 5-kinase [Kocuria]MCT1802745.1 glutamate 5-kinase [Kocuria carniphila]PBB07899.1 glutamate 5-kinase [Kocuria sp. WRN011]PZP30548.1 MAG: glutamate 5-kinase [Kocuria rhizophila]
MSEKTTTEKIDVAAVEQDAAKSAMQLSTENRGKNRRSPITERAQLPQARRVVVKVGSSSLTSVENSIDENALRSIVDALGGAKARGTDVIFVSSGAITAGLSPLGLAKRPKDLSTKQAAASVGQGLLISRYTDYFARYGITVGQVLVTAEDLMRHSQYKNAHRQIERLLDLGILPIVNENDAVATHEIKFGDNDRIAALVAHLIKADALLLLSDVDALYTKPPKDGGERIARIDDPIADLEGVEIGSVGRVGVGSGGMVTKVQAARIAAASGIPALVTSAGNINEALAGEDVGTWFSTTGGRRNVRLLWLAHLADIKGTLTLDDGAVEAIRGRRSLLAAGVNAVTGKFTAGDPVSMVDKEGDEVAHGLINYGSDEVPGMLGKRTDELGDEFGEEFARELIHVDNLVTLRPRSAKTKLKQNPAK